MSRQPLEEMLSKQREKIFEERSKPEFKQRHIAALTPVSQWGEHDLEIQRKHNRILQVGYSELDVDTVIDVAQAAKEDWLTDFVCPRVSNACKLNIAADLITQFKVSSEDLNKIVHQIYQKILEKDAHFVANLEEEIEVKINANQGKIKENAINRMKKIFPDLSEAHSDHHATLNKLIQVENQREKKAITHNLLKEKLQPLPLYAELTTELGIDKKPTFAKGENIDYSILGAAGSGKSTISNELIKGDKTDYVILATDDYRGIILDEDNERVETDQVFTRTQDTAYSIKELVQDRLTGTTLGRRPNVILDCVSLEGWHRELLKNNKKTVSAVACLDDVSLVPHRAYTRALDPTGGPADKGRQVNTTALLKGHALASAYLTKSIPLGCITSLYNTNVERGSTPPLLARINTEKAQPQIEVFDLIKLSTFLAKSNVNYEAQCRGELYYDKKRDYAKVNDSQYKADQLLGLTKLHKHEIVLKSAEGSPYAKISMKDDKMQFEVLNREMLQKVLEDSYPQSEGWLLKCVIMQIHFGSIEEVRKGIKEKSWDQMLAMASNSVIPDVSVNIKQSRLLNMWDSIPPEKKANLVEEEKDGVTPIVRPSHRGSA